MAFFKLFGVSLLLLVMFAASSTTGSSHQPIEPGKARLNGFVSNVGQWPTDVLFMARQKNAVVWITKTGVVTDEYTMSRDLDLRTGTVARQEFIGGRLMPVVGLGEPISTMTFFKGRNGAYAASAPVYSAVTIQDVYPGVSLRYTYNLDNKVERTISVAPGADASVIRTKTFNGNRTETSAVTPVTSMVYGSYIGGNDEDEMIDLVLLGNGDVVVGGNTTIAEFPGATGGYSTTVKGVSDAFLARFDRKLQKVISYTVLGGTSQERMRAMVRDKIGNIYLTGETYSSDFPITSGVSGKLYKSGADAFIAKVDSTLTKLIIGGYHGGNKNDIPRAIAVDKNFLIYIAGASTSTDNFPVTFPATITITLIVWPYGTRTVPGGGRNEGQTDGFIASFSQNGSMQQSRFFGREGIDIITAMAVDASSSVYLTGSTTSATFETAPIPWLFASGRLPYDRTFNGGVTDAFAVKLTNELALAKSDDGTYSTFFGGAGEDEGRGIVVDNLGRAYVVGVTTSEDLPAFGTLVTQAIGQQDVFLAVFSDDGRELVGTTYFGGTGADGVTGLVSYQGSSVVIYGTTQSNEFPTFGDGSTGGRAGPTDGYISVLNISTNRFTTLIPGSGSDTVRKVVVDPVGDLYYLMTTTSNDVRTPDTTYDKTVAGTDGFVGKFAFGILELLAPSGGETWCVGGTRSISWSNSGLADTLKYRIEIAPADREEWTEIAKDRAGRNYQWRIGALETGQYRIRVRTDRGHVSQLTTPFTISNPPIITQQPKNSSACPNNPVTLSVSAIGAGLMYQWKKSGTDIPGANESSYSISELTNATIGQYSCAVTGACTPAQTSQVVTVSFATPTAITTQPVGTTVEEGRTFTLSVVASGVNLEYQWMRNNSPIANATTPQYKVDVAALADAGAYACEVTGGCGKATTASVNVVVTPAVSVQGEEEFGGQYLRLLGPSPANQSVTIRLRLTASAEVLVRVYDTRGAVVSAISMGTLASGLSDIEIPLAGCNPGLHFIEVAAGTLLRRIPATIVR